MNVGDAISYLFRRRRGIPLDSWLALLDDPWVNHQYVKHDFKKLVPNMSTAFLGKYILPANGPYSGQFGPRARHPVTGKPAMHWGIDIAAPAGSPVWSVDNGEVAFAGVQRGYGNVVIIRHTDARETLYAHLSAILVRLGDAVQAGQEIGRVGSTGRVTGPHLHFELRVKGERVDPIEYLL